MTDERREVTPRTAFNRLTRGQRVMMAGIPHNYVVGSLFKPGYDRRSYPALLGAGLLQREVIGGVGEMFYLTSLGDRVRLLATTPEPPVEA